MRQLIKMGCDLSRRADYVGIRTLRSRENLTPFDVACLLLTIFGVVSGKQAIYAYRQQIRTNSERRHSAMGLLCVYTDACNGSSARSTRSG